MPLSAVAYPMRTAALYALLLFVVPSFSALADDDECMPDPHLPNQNTDGKACTQNNNQPGTCFGNKCMPPDGVPEMPVALMPAFIVAGGAVAIYVRRRALRGKNTQSGE